VTPLVDIVLVLLIIVMVTAPLIVHQQLAMDLPKAAKGQEQQIFFGVDIGANNEVQVDGKAVDGMEKVLPLAKEALAKNAELRATIRADSSVPHGTVMRVVDLLKQAGISRIAFGVSQTAPEIDKTPVPVNP
jgi:biopolymer transport protein ExbD